MGLRTHAGALTVDREVVEQAVRAEMDLHDVDAPGGLEVLREAAQEQGVDLVEAAAQVVEHRPGASSDAGSR